MTLIDDLEIWGQTYFNSNIHNKICIYSSSSSSSNGHLYSAPQWYRSAEALLNVTETRLSSISSWIVPGFLIADVCPRGANSRGWVLRLRRIVDRSVTCGTEEQTIRLGLETVGFGDPLGHSTEHIVLAGIGVPRQPNSFEQAGKVCKRSGDARGASAARYEWQRKCDRTSVVSGRVERQHSGLAAVDRGGESWLRRGHCCSSPDGTKWRRAPVWVWMELKVNAGWLVVYKTCWHSVEEWQGGEWQGEEWNVSRVTLPNNQNDTVQMLCYLLTYWMAKFYYSYEEDPRDRNAPLETVRWWSGGIAFDGKFYWWYYTIVTTHAWPRCSVGTDLAIPHLAGQQQHLAIPHLAIPTLPFLTLPFLTLPFPTSPFLDRVSAHFIYYYGSNLTQLVEADLAKLGDMSCHGQFRVQKNAKIPGGLVGDQCLREVGKRG